MFILILSISAVNAQDTIENDVGICDMSVNSAKLEDYPSMDEIGSFTDLNDEISKIAPGGNFTLKTDYAYSSNDSNYKSGIRITQDNIVIDGNGHTIDGSGQSRIFDIASNNVTLKNINFVNGYSSENGGAIFAISNLNILNSVFNNNVAKNFGGAVYIENAILNCEINSIFRNNSATSGGAIYFKNRIVNATINGFFEGNKAERAGGAIAVQGEFTNNTIASEFYNNSANAASGGAIFLRSLAENNMFESIFRYNYAFYGAGIFFYYKANNNKFNSDFRFNVAKSCGGAIFFYNTTNYNNFSGYFINNSALGKVDEVNGNGGAITFKDVSCNSIFTCDFVNNTAAKHGGGLNYKETPHNITLSSNFINNKAKSGGGVNFFESFENVVFDGYFMSNSAVYGGAIAIKNGDIENTSFWNNSARDGGAIYFDDDGTVSGCEFKNNSFIGSYGDGGAVYFRNRGIITNCNFTNNKAVYYAGAVYFGDDGKVHNSNFKDNEAQNGGSVYIYGAGEVVSCNFTNNNARTGGAIEFWQSGIVYNSNFNNNFARFSGGAIYCSDNLRMSNCSLSNNSAEQNAGGAIYCFKKADISQCNFTDNSASVGGAVYLYGDGGIISKSVFFDNFADEKGGAIFLEGSNSNFNIVNFTGNNATKGSAIYKTANADDFIITNVVFGRNRANSSEIQIVVDGNGSSALNNKITIYVYLLGNDNIANAIWNNGGIDTIKLANVSCEFSQDGNGRKLLRFNEDTLQNPTDGFVDDSAMWQSLQDKPVEDAQILDILITNEDSAVILYNLTNGSVHKSNTRKANLLLLSDDSNLKVTDVDGKITIELENLKAGKYNINSKHVGDEYYTEMAENSTFVIYDVNLNVVKTANVDVAYNNTLVNFTITLQNVGLGNATEVTLVDLLPDTLIYSNWGIINNNGAVIVNRSLNNGVEFNISNITSGSFVSIWIEALTNGVGDLTNNVTAYCKENDTEINSSATVTVIPKVVPPVNPGNDASIKPVDNANINKSAGNPILALLMVLSILCITTKRKK